MEREKEKGPAVSGGKTISGPGLLWSWSKSSVLGRPLLAIGWKGVRQRSGLPCVDRGSEGRCLVRSSGLRPSRGARQSSWAWAGGAPEETAPTAEDRRVHMTSSPRLCSRQGGEDRARLQPASPQSGTLGRCPCCLSTRRRDVVYTPSDFTGLSEVGPRSCT